MDIIKRKILIKKSLKPVDSDNDGVLDSLTLSADDLFVQIPLKHTIKDIGVYTDEQEEEEVINLDSIWDTSNDGSGEIEEEEDDEVTTDYIDGEIFGGGGSVTKVGCMDTNALNYNSDANQACPDCCEYPVDDSSTSADLSSGSDDFGQPVSCHTLTGSWTDTDKWSNWSSTAKDIAKAWCKATDSRCSSYGIKEDCGGNLSPSSVSGKSLGCTGSMCCPGPKETWKWVDGTGCPKDYDCVEGNDNDCCTSRENNKLLKNVNLTKMETRDVCIEYCRSECTKCEDGSCKKTATKCYSYNPGTYYGCNTSGGSYCNKTKKQYRYYFAFSCIKK